MDNTTLGSGVAAIVLFLLSHLGIAIWFASKMNTKVSQIAKSVSEMTDDIKLMAIMNTRVTVLESRMSRTEEDLREVLKAAALVNRGKESKEA